MSMMFYFLSLQRDISKWCHNVYFSLSDIEKRQFFKRYGSRLNKAGVLSLQYACPFSI